MHRIRLTSQNPQHPHAQLKPPTLCHGEKANTPIRPRGPSSGSFIALRGATPHTSPTPTVEPSQVNTLFGGDVFGSAGRHIVREHLPHVLETNDVDLLVINGENAAGGFGITPSIAEELFDLGAHVITTGNHIWDKKEIFEYMAVPADSHERGRRVLRPANYAVGTPGFGVYQGSLGNGQPYAVMNLQGRVFMSSCDD